MFKRKSSSAVLLGSAAASMAACSAQNTAKARILLDVLKAKVKDINVLDVLKAPWTAERWLSYDSWVALNKVVRENPLAAMFIGLPVLCLAALWVTYNGLIIAGIYSVVKGALDYSRQRENKAMLEKLSKDKGNVDKFAKERFSKEDFGFIKNIEVKYGKEYSDFLKESFLKYLLNCEVGSKTKSCEEYFKEDFLLDNSESDEYFNKYKDNAEKDYGLIGPKVVTKDDKKFIEEELPELKEELDFLKKNSNAGKNEEKDSPEKDENDKKIVESFRSSYIKYCHLCNKREKVEKKKDKKERNSLTAKEYFLSAYMNKIPAEKAIKGYNYLRSMGNDYYVENCLYEKNKNCGLAYNLTKKESALNLVSEEEFSLFNELALKKSGSEADEVKDCFKKYVFYLHDCNKQFKKAEKNFESFCKEKNILLEKIGFESGAKN